jgi:hypothetical protein
MPGSLRFRRREQVTEHKCDRANGNRCGDRFNAARQALSGRQPDDRHDTGDNCYKRGRAKAGVASLPSYEVERITEPQRRDVAN